MLRNGIVWLFLPVRSCLVGIDNSRNYVPLTPVWPGVFRKPFSEWIWETQNSVEWQKTWRQNWMDSHISKRAHWQKLEIDSISENLFRSCQTRFRNWFNSTFSTVGCPLAKHKLSQLASLDALCQCHLHFFDPVFAFLTKLTWKWGIFWKVKLAETCQIH